LDDRGDDPVADRDIRSFFARFAQGEDPRGAAAKVNERLIAAHGGDNPFDDLARTKRTKRALVLLNPSEELLHRLGLAVRAHSRIDGHDRARANDVPHV